MLRILLIAATILISLCSVSYVQAKPNRPTAGCGEVVTIATHDGTTMRYALSYPKNQAGQVEAVALLLLPGGSGFIDLDEAGCPRSLRGNYLVRSIALFKNAGLITALVDAPSDHHTDDGLAGFRITAQHAEDLGRVIADLRARTKARVWIVGTSRGSISAANAAARLSGEAAPDGVVLTSALMSGQSGARRVWVSQTVFDLPLEAIRAPLLLVGHSGDRCVRSPAELMVEIADRTNGIREQVVTVTGGPGPSGTAGVAACEGRSPHGFLGQEKEVIDGMARFIRGGEY